MKIGHLVKQLGIVDQGLKAVRYSLGNIHRAIVGIGQLGCMPAGVGGRIRPQIKNDIVNGSPRTADQLVLLAGGTLIMHSPQRALAAIDGNTALNQPGVQTMRFKFTKTPGTGEKTSFIRVSRRFDQKCSGNWQRGEFHEPARQYTVLEWE